MRGTGRGVCAGGTRKEKAVLKMSIFAHQNTKKGVEIMKIGDIIVALSEADMRYSITNTSMGRAYVVGVDGDQITIKAPGKGKFDVDSKFFKKIGKVKPFDRTEVIRLLSEGKTSEIFYYDLYGAGLSGANLSGALNLLESFVYIDAHFEKTDKGYIAYKTFGSFNTPPAYWIIEPDSIICENVNSNRTEECGCGVNVGTLDWVKKNTNGQVWKVLIEWPWLAGVVVPYSTDGKIRCERVRLLEKIEG